MLDMDVMGIILPDRNGMVVGDLTSVRSISALPFGGRYRLIDFALSNMVNAGVNTVVVCPSLDASSLVDHIGSGKPWDLNRKYKGLTLLTPKTLNANFSDVEVLYNNINYFKRAKERYVIISYGHMVFNNSLRGFVDFHKEKNADVTLMHHRNPVTTEEKQTYSMSVMADGKIDDMVLGYEPNRDLSYSCGIMILEKNALVDMLKYCYSRNLKSLIVDYVLKNISEINAYGFETKGYFGIINDVASYYRNNMNMLRQEVRNEIFAGSDLIYTKTKDSAPTRYGSKALVDDSLIADGSIINGTVKNSIIARDVRISEGSVVENSIIMQGGFIGPDCVVKNAIFDKAVTVRDGRTLIGDETYPFMVSKGSTI